MKVNIREVTDPNEIIKAFSHLYTDRSKVLLWQTSKADKSKKTLIYCELISIDHRNIYLTPYNTSIKQVIKKTIKTTNKIFIRGSYNGVLFKSTDFTINGDTIEVPIPKKILLSENRSNKRNPIPESLYVYVKFKDENDQKNHKKNHRSSFKIFDFSRQGLSINMSKKDSHFFEINKSYEISTINGVKLPKSFNGKLIYQKVHTYIKNSKTQILFKAGFKLSEPIPLELYNHLVRLCDAHKVQKLTA